MKRPGRDKFPITQTHSTSPIQQEKKTYHTLSGREIQKKV